jgi:hypothetical protein
MATYTVWTFRCPRCKADIGRRFGLITTLTISCPKCRTPVRIDSNVIQQNWGFNFGWVGFVLLWFGLACGVLASPEFAAQIGRKTFPSGTDEERLVIAAVCVLPAFLGALLFGGVGMVLGAIAALAAPQGREDDIDRTSWPTRPAAAAPPPRPRQRGFLVRAFFVLLWTGIVLLGMAFTLGLVAERGVKPTDEPLPAAAARTVGLMASPLGHGPLLAAVPVAAAGAQDDLLKQQAVKKAGETSGPWVLLGTLAVFILGCVGLLPCTSRKLKDEPRPVTAPA